MESKFIGKQFRQVSHRLRIHRPGKPDNVSERPREGNREDGWGQYLDGDDNPTLIAFEAGDVADVADLLRMGAIVEYEPPQVEAEEAGDGEG